MKAQTPAIISLKGDVGVVTLVWVALAIPVPDGINLLVLTDGHVPVVDGGRHAAQQGQDAQVTVSCQTGDSVPGRQSRNSVTRVFA